MISAKEVINNKVVELNKIYNFYFGHFFIQQNDSSSLKKQSDSNIVHKFYISLIWFQKTIREIYKIKTSSDTLNKASII
jgi:hypothetical protein